MTNLAKAVDELLESAAKPNDCDYDDDAPKLNLRWWVGPDVFGSEHYFVSMNYNHRYSCIDDMLEGNRRRFPDIYKNI